MLAALLYLVSIVGLLLCYFGLVVKKTPIKCLLIMLSVLGIAVLPITLYFGVSDWPLRELINYFAGLSVLIFATTIAAFYFMDLSQATRW